ncbi:methyltransferase domain-containing protein [Agaribacter flavus]|uniref:Methyltransferase domain-containing protein n=1 Tax=Agaribacter flavus TaxID=1902781 RepID=A0ABV7FQJ9_9ALTE
MIIAKSQTSTIPHQSKTPALSLARQFDKAASSYDASAFVQAQVIERLCKQITENRILKTATPRNNVAYFVDIGSGTGALYRSLNQVCEKKCEDTRQHWLNIDLSHGMLRHSQSSLPNLDEKGLAAHRPKPYYIQADANKLPFIEASVQNVYSSMALQWCNSPSVALNEIARVLIPRGQAHLALMVAPSFSHVKACWDQAGYMPRVNDFHTSEAWLDALPSRLSLKSNSLISIAQKFDSLKDLLMSIKSVGANTTMQQKSRYMSKQEYQSVEQCIRMSEKGLLLNYEVLFLHLQKQ